MKLKAFLDFELKSADDEQRLIKGVATTPRLDRVGDIVEPLGAKFAKTIPLFLYHDHTKSVGEVELGKPTKDGVPFTAKLPKVLEAGNLRDRVDEAWQMVKYGLIRAVSIGFQNLGGSEPLKSGGKKFLNTEIFELSLVPIPANPDAAIQFYRSAFQEQQSAASGAALVASGIPTHYLSSGVSGNSTSKGTRMQTSIAEQISIHEAERAFKMKQIDELLGDGNTLNEDQQKQFDELSEDAQKSGKQIENLRKREQLFATATPVSGDPEKASQERQDAGRPTLVTHSRSNHPKGTGFTRLAMAYMAGKGSESDTEKYIQRHFRDTPEVMLSYKAAVAAGTTTDANWAAPLVNYTDLASEFIDLLRPLTILGRMNSLNRVPFNVRMAKLASGATGGWVGQGLAKPVSALDFDTVTFAFFKMACIVVLTQELVRFSSPSAEAAVRNELLAAIAQLEDVSFIDPSIAGTANVQPASITNGVTAIGNPGTTVATITTALTTAISNAATANINLGTAVWVMRPKTAVYLSTLRTTQDVLAFPGMGLTGGNLLGFPVIVSGNVPADTGSSSFIAFIVQSEVFLADDGTTRIDASDQASIQMDSAPSAGAQALVSLWQNNMVGLRAERFANWARRRTEGVQLIEDVSF